MKMNDKEGPTRIETNDPAKRVGSDIVKDKIKPKFLEEDEIAMLIIEDHEGE